MALKNTMKTAAGSISLLLLWTLQLANTQQFDTFRAPYEQLGLSKDCTDVLNTTVSCDGALASVTQFDRPSVDVLYPVTLGKICIAKCHDDLQSLRTRIMSTCNRQTDLIVFEKTAYPATFILDHYIYQYDVSCYADKKTGQLCDLYLGSLRNQSKQPDKCSDCILGVYTVQLSSPLGYYDEIARQFSSIKSQCGTAAATYSYTRTAYTTSPVPSKPVTTTSTTTKSSTVTTATAPAEPTAPPLMCDRKYTVAQNDTCSSIALAQKASTYDIVTLNALSVSCSDLPKPGTEICLPSPCTPYKVVVGDTCTGIANKGGVSVDELLAWNPIFSFRCANIDKWWDSIICVGVGNGTGPTTIRTVTTSTTTAPIKPTISMGPLQPGKPHAPGSVSSCRKWRDSEDAATDENGSDMSSLNKCRFVTSNAEISMVNFVTWNPSLKSDAGCKLDPKYSYCVAGPDTTAMTSATSNSSGGAAKAPSVTVTSKTTSMVTTAKSSITTKSNLKP